MFSKFNSCFFTCVSFQTPVELKEEYRQFIQNSSLFSESDKKYLIAQSEIMICIKKKAGKRRFKNKDYILDLETSTFDLVWTFMKVANVSTVNFTAATYKDAMITNELINVLLTMDFLGSSVRTDTNLYN